MATATVKHTGPRALLGFLWRTYPGTCLLWVLGGLLLFACMVAR